jgi:hypothetical protein
LVSATRGTKKENQLIITNKPEEKYTDRLNGPSFDLTYQEHEEGEPAHHHKQARGKVHRQLERTHFWSHLPGERRRRTSSSSQTSQRKSTQKDWIDPLLISPTGGTKKENQLIITNKPEEKYTDRLNGPTFDLTYRGHEEGEPAHHHKQAGGKVHRQIERTHFWSHLPGARRRRTSSSSQTSQRKSTQTDWTDPLLISPTWDTKKGNQLTITNKPGAQRRTPLFIKNKSGEKFKIRLNGPTFDLTYRQHGGGDPAHHPMQAGGKVHRQVEGTHFWSQLPGARRRRPSSSSQTSWRRSTQTDWTDPLLISPIGGTKKETQLIITTSQRKSTQTNGTDPLLISAAGGTKKETQLIITNKLEEKYTDRLNGPTFDLTYRGHEEGDPAHHHKQAGGKVHRQIERIHFWSHLPGARRRRPSSSWRTWLKEGTQTDWTDPLLISPTGGTKKETQLIITNKPKKKYTDRLNGPNFDLTYRGHEEGDPAHHDEHGWRKVHREDEWSQGSGRKKSRKIMFSLIRMYNCTLYTVQYVLKLFCKILLFIFAFSSYWSRIFETWIKKWWSCMLYIFN